MLINIIPFHWCFALETAVKSDFLLSCFLHMNLFLDCADSQSFVIVYFFCLHSDHMEMLDNFVSEPTSSRISSFLLPPLHCVLHRSRIVSLVHCFCSIDHLNQILQGLLLKLSPAQPFLWSVDIWGSDKKLWNGWSCFWRSLPSSLPFTGVKGNWHDSCTIHLRVTRHACA